MASLLDFEGPLRYTRVPMVRAKSAAVLSIDQGTTSVRATVLDAALRPVASASAEVPRSFPAPGWVELDADALVRATDAVAARAMDAAPEHEVLAWGLANQGETVALWDRRTGEPLAPAVVWQCRRTETEAASLAARSDVAWVQEATGLPIDPYFSATKLAWLLDHVPGARERAARGELAAGTLDTFTLFRLSQGRVFATEPSTACRTLLAELETGRFSRRLCDLFGVPWGLLPEVVASDADLGVVPIGGRDLPLRGLLCDQPSALLGVGCVAPGDVKCTYGTGAFLQVHTGERPAPPSRDDGLLRSIAWERNGQRVYLLEGSVLAAGDVLTWLQSLGILGPASGIDALLEAHPDASGVLFAPTLTGLGAPRWVGDARGTLLGLHRGVTPGHLVRAALEGIAHQVVDVLEAASKAFSAELGPLRADGGLSASQRFLALQADLAGRPLLAPHVGEATTRGVGALVAHAAGLVPSVESALAGQTSELVAPSLSHAQRAELRRRHHALLDLATAPDALELVRAAAQRPRP
jgi:glycerol kinase